MPHEGLVLGTTQLPASQKHARVRSENRKQMGKRIRAWSGAGERPHLTPPRNLTVILRRGGRCTSPHGTSWGLTLHRRLQKRSEKKELSCENVREIKIHGTRCKGEHGVVEYSKDFPQ